MLTETVFVATFATHRCAKGDDVCCERVRTSDASGVWVRSQTLAPISPLHFWFDRKRRYHRSRLRPRSMMKRTSAAIRAIEDDDVRTLWVDTDSHGNRWKPFGEKQSTKATPPSFGIWMRRLLLQILPTHLARVWRCNGSLSRDASAGGHRLSRLLFRSAERLVRWPSSSSPVVGSKL